MCMPSLTSHEYTGAVEYGHAVEVDLLQHVERQRAGDRDAENRHGVRARPPDLPPEQPGDDGRDQRQHGEWRAAGSDSCAHQPFSVFRSSTLMLRRSRNSTTRMARPMADSAAATVSTKNTNTCPLMSPR